MKYLIFLAFCMAPCRVFCQNFQLHYDLRHTAAPGHTQRNFPTFSFEYFRQLDSARGSFLLKTQADLSGNRNNVGQVFTQVSQSLRFWKPKVFLSLSYSGGLGVTSSSYGFHLDNTYSTGVSYPFQWQGAFLATNVLFRYNAFEKASYDPQLVLYFFRGFRNYKIMLSGSFVGWTENRNRGTEFTAGLHGKKFAFFGDPQLWFRIVNGFALGSRVNVFYHLLSDKNSVQFYPTIGGRYQF